MDGGREFRAGMDNTKITILTATFLFGSQPLICTRLCQSDFFSLPPITSSFFPLTEMPNFPMVLSDLSGMMEDFRSGDWHPELPPILAYHVYWDRYQSRCGFQGLCQIHSTISNPHTGHQLARPAGLWRDLSTAACPCSAPKRAKT